MRQEIASVALLVRDYDEAISYFTGGLRFTVVEDTIKAPSLKELHLEE